MDGVRIDAHSKSVGIIAQLLDPPKKVRTQRTNLSMVKNNPFLLIAPNRHVKVIVFLRRNLVNEALRP